MVMILDSTGTSYGAKVDQNHELYTRSRVIGAPAAKAVNGDLYIVSSNSHAVTTTEGLICWFYFSDTVNSLAVSSLAVSWNGGDTNKNRTVLTKFMAGTGQPSGNYTTLAARNTNTNSSKALSATGLQWEGTGTGMTGASTAQEVLLSQYYFAQGITTIPIDGKIILAPGTPIGLYCDGEELGKFTISMYFYLYEPGLDI